MKYKLIDKFISKELFNSEIENLKKKSWVLVGHLKELKNFNDYKTLEIFNLPVIIYNIQGNIKAFTNICPHRGSRIKLKDKGCEVFKCAYHGWAFNKDGRLISGPFIKEAFENLNIKDVRLETWKIDLCGGVIFITHHLNKKVSLREYLGKQFKLLDIFSNNFHEIISTEEYIWNCNWKIAVENSIDEYHGPILHSNTFKRVLDLKPHYSYDNNFLSVEMPLNKNYLSNLKNISKYFEEKNLNQTYIHSLVFPISTLASTMGIFNFLQIYSPISVNKTKIYTNIFFSKLNVKEDKKLKNIKNHLIDSAKKFNKEVFFEDKNICEDLQKNLDKGFIFSKLGKFENRIKKFRDQIL